MTNDPQIPTTEAVHTPGVVDFGIGQPDFDILPLELIGRAVSTRLAQGDTSLLNYGYGQGDGYVRLALAAFLTRGYGAPVDADSLVVTGGASQALDLLCTLYTQPGDVVIVEEPTYFIALRIFADHHLKVVGVPVDGQGMDISALEAVLATERPAMLYTIPVFQNPTGATLTPARRSRLVELARQHDFLVVADEVYQLLAYGEPPPVPLASAIDSGHVVSLGSFSKILAPGLRLGWLQAAPAIVDRLVDGGLIYSGGSLNHFTSNIVRPALEEGMQQTYLETLRGIFRRRIDVMDAELQAHLGDTVRYRKPDGGYFFWLELAEAQDAVQLQRRAEARKLGFLPGSRFSGRDGLRNYLRLSFAFYNEDEIRDGIRRLAPILRLPEE